MTQPAPPPIEYHWGIEVHPPRWWRRQWKAVATLHRKTQGGMEWLGVRPITLVALAPSEEQARARVQLLADCRAQRERAAARERSERVESYRTTGFGEPSDANRWTYP